MFEMEFKFSKVSSIRSKAVCLVVSEQAKWLTSQSKVLALHHHLLKQAFTKRNKKKK